MASQNEEEEPTVPHIPLSAFPHPFTGDNLPQRNWRLWFSDPRHRVLAASLGLLLVGTLVAVGLLGIATAKPDGYLFTSQAEVAFIQFTADQSGHLSGSLQDISATSTETIESKDNAFTGIQNGSQISLTFSALGFSANINGTLNGDTLTLHMPDQTGYVATEVFHAASVSDYNTAATQLRHQIAAYAVATQSALATAYAEQAQVQATETAQTSLDDAVTTANSQLSSDLRALNSDTQSLASSTDFSTTLTAYANDWATMQKDYQQELSDYQQGCGVGGYNAGVVSYDAGVVKYDLGTIQYDDGSLAYDDNSMSGRLKQVQHDMQAVQTDWNNLQRVVAADQTGTATAQFTANDVNSAVANAQKQVDTSNTARQSAQSQAQQYDNEAAQLNTNAQNLATSMHC